MCEDSGVIFFKDRQTSCLSSVFSVPIRETAFEFRKELERLFVHNPFLFKHHERYTATRRFATGIRPEKCVFSRFRRCGKVYLHKPRWYSLLHTYAIWCSLLLLGYKPLQNVSVLNAVGNCNTMVL
jgi:hypothetical protein